MNEQFQSAILEIAERLLHTARTDDRLRSSIRLCAEEVLALTTEPVPPAAKEAPSQVGTEQTGVDLARSPVGRELPLLASAPSPKPKPVAVPFDLAVTKSRFFLKAEAARWASKRIRLLAEGADLNLEIMPQDQEFIRRGQEEDCYPWMLGPYRRHPSSPDQFDLIAAWYDNLAEALALLDVVITEGGWQSTKIKHSLELAAASQSALRVAVADCDGYRDEDQQAMFEWLREVADEHDIFIEQGMRLLDPTDPSEWADIAGRLHAVARDFQERQQQTRKKKKLLAKVRHKASVVAANRGGSMEATGELMAVVDELVKAGIPPSNKELRETLLPVLDQLPTRPDMPDGFRLAVREIDKYKQNVLSFEAASEDSVPVGVVQDARKLLAGRSAVLIGGEGRTEASEALEQSLGLKELIWINTSKHDSYLDFERFVARPDVAVILLAIRWSSHSFGEVSSLCERHGKPLVRLPGGYNPNQVAHQIMTQAGIRLVKK